MVFPMPRHRHHEAYRRYVTRLRHFLARRDWRQAEQALNALEDSMSIIAEQLGAATALIQADTTANTALTAQVAALTAQLAAVPPAPPAPFNTADADDVAALGALNAAVAAAAPAP